jgi:small subunit ribosomal protein S6
MRHYEVVVLAASSTGNQGEMADRYKQMVGDGGGQVHRFEDWGVRPLAYPINKKTHAHYFLYNIECDQKTLEQLRETFRFSESVLRSLIVRCEKAITDPSPIMKKREEDENAQTEEVKPKEERGGNEA